MNIKKSTNKTSLILSSAIVMLLLFTYAKLQNTSKTFSFKINKNITLRTNELPFDIYKNGKKLRLKRFCSGYTGETAIQKCIDGKIVKEETNMLCGFPDKWCKGCSDAIDIQKIRVDETFEWDGVYYEDGWIRCGREKYSRDVEKKAGFGSYKVKVEGETIKEFKVP